MEKKKAMIIDMGLLCLIACLLDAVTLALLRPENALYCVSLSMVLMVMILFRWQYFVLIPASILGFMTCVIANDYSYSALLTYMLGNLFIGLPLLLSGMKVDEIKENNARFIFFIILTLLSVAIGRGVVAAVVTLELAQTGNYIVAHIAGILMDLPIAIIALFFARGQNGMLINFNEQFKLGEVSHE